MKTAYNPQRSKASNAVLVIMSFANGFGGGGQVVSFCGFEAYNFVTSTVADCDSSERGFPLST
jgi:hypothetical protein